MSFTNSNIDLILETGIDLVPATQIRILYRKPDGTTGEWVGVADDTKATYATAVDDIDQPGTWTFQVVTTIGGKVLKGIKAEKEILNPIID